MTCAIRPRRRSSRTRSRPRISTPRSRFTKLRTAGARPTRRSTIAASPSGPGAECSRCSTKRLPKALRRRSPGVAMRPLFFGRAPLAFGRVEAMAKRTQLITPDVYQYVLRSSREPEVLARLRKATAAVPHSEMQIGADQGELLALLVKLIGARRCIEVGTYTGYSALAVALALPADGLLVACDVNEEWTSMGQPFWREAGVEARI